MAAEEKMELESVIRSMESELNSSRELVKELIQSKWGPSNEFEKPRAQPSQDAVDASMAAREKCDAARAKADETVAELTQRARLVLKALNEECVDYSVILGVRARVTEMDEAHPFEALTNAIVCNSQASSVLLPIPNWQIFYHKLGVHWTFCF